MLATLLAGVTFAAKGVDYSTLQSVAVHQCWKQNGMTFAMPRAYCSFGGMDEHGRQNVANARAAGIPYVDIYMFPCRGKSAQAQVSDLITNMGTSNYGMIWLDIETNPSTGCSWNSFSHASNCEYISELVTAIKGHGKVPGIYSSIHMWTEIMGAAANCNEHGSAPLWYAHYDDNPSFSDFTPFGGWTKPNIKQYHGTTTLCGGGVDLSWYP